MTPSTTHKTLALVAIVGTGAIHLDLARAAYRVAPYLGLLFVADGVGATVEARVQVHVILGGCVLHEVYTGRDGLTGESFTLYDAARGTWHQTWVTDRGQLLVLEGRLEGERMVLVGADRAADGTPRLVRGAWSRVEGGVRERAEVSRDRGETWTVWFDLVFRPHRPDAGR